MKFLDYKGLATLVESIKERFVEKEEGKSLSSNDYTDEEKKKLGLLSPLAEENVINSIKRNGSLVEVKDKTVDIKVPIRVSDLTNDEEYQSKSEVLQLISENGRIKKKIVDQLPPVKDAEENTLYLIRNKTDDGYEEWMIVENTWEILGDTAAVNLEGFLTEEDVKVISEEEIKELL